MNFLKGTFLDPERGDQIDFLAVPFSIWESSIKPRLENTSWKKEIPIVSKESYEDATYGDPLPLRRQLGTPPKVRAKRLPLEESLCQYYQDESCPERSENCRPGLNLLPECYFAPSDILETSLLMTEIGRAWDEGRYVFIIGK